MPVWISRYVPLYTALFTSMLHIQCIDLRKWRSSSWSCSSPECFGDPRAETVEASVVRNPNTACQCYQAVICTRFPNMVEHLLRMHSDFHAPIGFFNGEPRPKSFWKWRFENLKCWSNCIWNFKSWSHWKIYPRRIQWPLRKHLQATSSSKTVHVLCSDMFGCFSTRIYLFLQRCREA